MSGGEKSFLELIVTEYRHLHLSIGILGNALFLIGSVLFFKSFEAWQETAVWLFVIGSALMLIGALGKAAQDILENTK
jgi:hypothetical protein